MAKIVDTNKGKFKLEPNMEEFVLYAVNTGDDNHYYTLPMEMADKSEQEIVDYINEIE